MHLAEKRVVMAGLGHCMKCLCELMTLTVFRCYAISLLSQHSGWEKIMKKFPLLAIIVVFAVKPALFAQNTERAGSVSDGPPPVAHASGSFRTFTARSISSVTFIPYCIDMAWQVPTGGRLGWITASAANPDPLPANARVFLLRGTGTVFSPGFGEICTRLRRAGIWAEDLGPAGDAWVCRHVIAEQRAGRLRGPIVLVGHSRGARHAVEVARELDKAGIDVDLLVCLDVSLPPTVPGNVRAALNIYYMSQHRFYPADPLRSAPGANVLIDNVDLSSPEGPATGLGLCHVTIAAGRAVQDLVVGRIVQTVHEAPRRAIGKMEH